MLQAARPLTFGSRSSSRAGSKGSLNDVNASPTPSPVFKCAHGHARKRSSLVPADLKNSQGSLWKTTGSPSMPIPPEAKRVLGLAGTMGGSVTSCHAAPELDANDPDSDIPDELQFILSGQSDEESMRSLDDTLSFRPDAPKTSPPSLGLPHVLPLPPVIPAPSPVAVPSGDVPVFRVQLIDEEANHADVD